MKMFKTLAGVLGICLAVASQAAVVTDTVGAPNPAFDFEANNSAPLTWTHGAISGSIQNATLTIDAYDVDSNPPAGDIPEVDVVSAFDAATSSWINLGVLIGGNKIVSSTVFQLTSDLFDDIANGLQVKVDVDTLTDGNWTVMLLSSTLSANTGGTVPEPGSLALLGIGLAAVARSMRRKASA